MTSLELRSVRKGRSGRCVLWDASVCFQEGVHLIEGENGVGKTTLLEVMSGLEMPTSGDVVLDGRSIHARGNRSTQRIVMIPAVAKFYEGASVDYAIRLYLSLRGLPVPRDIFESFDPFSLKRHATIPFGKLSLGWRKRLMLHMAFVADSDVLVLDEPTVGLDAKGIECLADLILRRVSGVTVIACHEPDTLARVPMEKYVLEDAAQGSVLVARRDKA